MKIAKISEDIIVSRLEKERWLHHGFKLKQLSAWKNVYFDAGQTKEADLVGVDYTNNVYAFEVKKEVNDIGAAFDQVCAYCYGANFVYAILEEKSGSKRSVEKFKKTGIGLLTYEIRKGKISKPTTKLVSVDHKGRFLGKTRSALPEVVDDPRCYIFPLESPNKIRRILHPSPKTRLVEYGYNAKRHLPSGSIVAFCSQNSIIGQGTVVRSRRTSKEQGIKESRVVFLWADSTFEYPHHVPLDEIKSQISSLQRHSGRALTMTVRRYPRMSFNECQLVVQKALENADRKSKTERHATVN